MINSFRNKYYFLSNFFPCIIMYHGVAYRSVESAFQAQKADTSLSDDARLEVQKRFANLAPDQAKHLGRHIVLRADWEKVKKSVMRDLLMVKFSNGQFRKLLLETGDEKLIEGNSWHDNYWGSCICPRCGNRGRNELGKMLMEVRDTLRNGDQENSK